MIPEQSYQQARGVITAVATPINEHMGMYSFQPVLICRDVDTHKIELGSSDALPLGIVTMNAHLQIWCQEGTQITIPSLDEARGQLRAITTLDGNCHPTIVKGARRIQHAFLNEDPEMFKELKNISLLRKIAYKALEHTGHADIIAEGMVGIFGRKRNLRIIGEVFESVEEAPITRKLTGSVVDILPLNPQSQKAEPTIVLETQKDGEETLYYAPFTAIKELRF